MSLGRMWFPLLITMILAFASSASAQAPTTGTLVLRAGSQLGEFRIGEKLVVRTRILRPDVNRDLEFKATSPAKGRQLLSSTRGQIKFAMIDPRTVAADFAVNKGTTGVAIIEVSAADAPTSAVINWSGNSVTTHDGTAPVVIQVDGAKVLRSLTRDGARIVAPLRAGETVRMTISREEMPTDALKKLDLSSLPAKRAPFSETASTVGPALRWQGVTTSPGSSCLQPASERTTRAG
ncbi:hypothetical protein GC173_05495 [bacterium]|nr:hypothetical protein [bacterium]